MTLNFVGRTQLLEVLEQFQAIVAQGENLDLIAMINAQLDTVFSAMTVIKIVKAAGLIRDCFVNLHNMEEAAAIHGKLVINWMTMEWEVGAKQ